MFPPRLKRRGFHTEDFDEPRWLGIMLGILQVRGDVPQINDAVKSAARKQATIW